MNGTVEQRLRAIVGRQRVIVTCWCCDTDYPEGSDRYRIDPDGFPVCADDNACNWRASLGGDAA